MLRTLSPVRAYGLQDVPRALEVCAQDPVTNVFVAARIRESGLVGTRGPLFGYEAGDEAALCWCSANVVPVEAGPRAIAALAAKVVRRRASASSVFGPADQVLDLWGRLERHWGPPREVRRNQLVMTMQTRPSVLGLPVDPDVRPADGRAGHPRPGGGGHVHRGDRLPAVPRQRRRLPGRRGPAHRAGALAGPGRGGAGRLQG
ncbi:DUF4081 domain-containing protein [Ornithinimicrobium flavum]|uniref:DUF4081 domain-containing protein n=1 Tax=Ornithinimicrobium flavum TaxID=1288636 RepID=UPI0030843D05